MAVKGRQREHVIRAHEKKRNEEFSKENITTLYLQLRPFLCKRLTAALRRPRDGIRWRRALAAA
jgi:hypothetical protein